jgi:hypothetical protein
MTRRALAVMLFVLAAGLYLLVARPAQRQRDDARREYATARTERERLRVRLADLDRRTSEDQGATAADGAAAVRALRQAALDAVEGLPVSGVEISTSPAEGGAIAARGRLVARAEFVQALRLVRRLASPGSGLLLSRITLADSRDAVRVDAETFILREAP